MTRKFSLLVISFIIVGTSIVSALHAQNWGGGGKNRAKVGHFYGRIVDSVTGKGVPFAPIQILGPKWDSVSQSMTSSALEGQLTADNGQFSFDKLPVMGTFTIQVKAMGYKPFQMTAHFDLSKLAKGGAQNLQNQSQSEDNSNPAAQAQQAESLINAIDKDLGNIKITPESATLGTVVVNGEPPPVELKLDKRVFDVSKNLTTTGGTAEDVLKSIPDVNVDIDGNVTLRNMSPTIYVDGLPTTLTIDQIPADQIDKIEVITNPSAKFDASAGSGGIINIIMKHNATPGYNGSVRAGIDKYGQPNGGLNFNFKQGKFNFFLNTHYHAVEHIMYGSETRDTVAGLSYTPGSGEANPFLENSQKDTNTMKGYFGYARTGFDYFIDNRNTLTLALSYSTGVFNTVDKLHTTTDTSRYAIGNEPISNIYQNSDLNRNFYNTGESILFKHLFPKEDENLTASITTNQSSSTGNGTIDQTIYNNNYDQEISYIPEEQLSNGTNYYYIGKADFTDPLTKRITLDAGTMVTLNNVTSNSEILVRDTEDLNETSTTTFNEQVYAAYFTFSEDLTSRLSYQVALREEYSIYGGQETLGNNNYQLNPQLLWKPFPGGFLTYHLTPKSDLQLSYTTHITRPSFSQLVVYNYTNPSFIQVPNPNLLPAYQNSFELNYINTFDKRNSLIISAYYKITYDIITAEVEAPQFNPALNEDEYINTYDNADYGYWEGLEFTGQNSPTQWLDITSNFNLFESGFNASNLNVSAPAPYLSYFAKLNLTFKLPDKFSFEVNSSYQSKCEIPPGGTGGGRWGGGGGGGYGGGVSPSTTGYIDPTYSIDGAVKKDFMKNNKASITFNIRDIFRTAVAGTYNLAETPDGTPLYYQTTSRIRDPQYYSINFSYRFGQTDVSLFKRKNNEIEQPENGMDESGSR